MGWGFGSLTLQSLLPGLASMKANTALAFVFSGAALWIPRTNPRAHRVAHISAAIVALTGILTLAQYLLDLDLHIDLLLFEQAAEAEKIIFPGRMSHATALNFFLLGVALLFLEYRRHHWLAEVFTFPVLVSSGVALIGYVYGVASLYRIGAYPTMAAHTATTFAVLSIGILFVRADSGLMSIVMSDSPGGTMARRLLPAAIVIPVLIGWLWLKGQQIGLYETDFGLTIFALSNIIIFAALIWWNSGLLYQMDLRHKRAAEALQENEARMRAVLNSALSAVLVIDAKGKIIDWNPRAEKIFGWKRHEALGLELAEIIIPPRYREAHRLGLKHFLATGEGPVMNQLIEMSALRRDGSEFPVELSISPLIADNAVTFCGFITDITERKRAEKALQENEQKFRAIFETAAVSIWEEDFSQCKAAIDDLKARGITDFRRYFAEHPGFVAQAVQMVNVLDVNQQTLKLYEAESKDDLLASLSRIFVPETLPVFAEELVAIAEGRTYFESEAIVQTLHGQRRNILFTISFPESCASFERVLVTIMDITKRKKAEEKFHGLLEFAPDAIVIVDHAGKIVLVNSQTEQLFGYNREELLGGSVEMLMPERFRRDHGSQRNDFISKPYPRPMGEGMELFGVRKDGAEIPVEISLSPLETEEGMLVMSAIRNITKRKQAEEKIKASLREKEVLLKEIHHRVKNNLQVISSLLKLQSKYIKDKRVIELFNESQQRVKSMALIHEELYKSADLARIKFASYVQSIADHLVRSYGAKSNTIDLKIDIDELQLDVDRAVPCGLIINELVTNSLKYAFPPEWRAGTGHRPCEISIDMHASDDGHLLLKISDNGVGLPEGLDFRHSESLGLQLVTTLTEQLRGSIDCRNAQGTEFEISFDAGKALGGC